MAGCKLSADLSNLQAFVLGLLQGLTEFLPVSSSAHLILLPRLANWGAQDVLYDVVAHCGSLLAVIAYCRRDLHRIISAWRRSFTQGPNAESRLAWCLLVATAPICLAGLLFRGALDSVRAPLVIAGATALFALLLWWADHCGKRTRDLTGLRLKEALLVGLLQALALVPGASRAGLVITAGLLLGLRRGAASRFSLLLAIPTILLATGYEALHVAYSGIRVDWMALLIVGAVSFISAMTAIHFFLKLVERTGMLPYIIYRLLLAALLFGLFH